MHTARFLSAPTLASLRRAPCHRSESAATTYVCGPSYEPLPDVGMGGGGSRRPCTSVMAVACCQETDPHKAQQGERYAATLLGRQAGRPEKISGIQGGGQGRGGRVSQIDGWIRCFDRSGRRRRGGTYIGTEETCMGRRAEEGGEALNGEEFDKRGPSA